MPPKKSTTKNLPGAVGIGSMGGLVRLDDVTRPQGRIVPDATPKNSGVMTGLQATQLAALVAGGGGGAGTLAKTYDKAVAPADNVMTATAARGPVTVKDSAGSPPASGLVVEDDANVTAIDAGRNGATLGRPDQTSILRGLILLILGFVVDAANAIVATIKSNVTLSTKGYRFLAFNNNGIDQGGITGFGINAQGVGIGLASNDNGALAGNGRGVFVDGHNATIEFFNSSIDDGATPPDFTMANDGTFTGKGAIGGNNNLGRAGSAPFRYCNAQGFVGGNQVAGAVGGAGAGTTPVITVKGGSSGFILTLTTDVDPTPNAIIATLLYTIGYPIALSAVPILVPANKAAAQLTASLSQPFIDDAQSTETQCVLMSNDNALDPNTTYVWAVHVMGRGV